MKIVSWNIQANRGADDARLAKVIAAIEDAAPDVVMLQEVAAAHALPERLRTALVGIGLPQFVYGDPGDTVEKRYGSAIASRHPLRSRPWPSRRWPQLAVAADIDVGRGLVAVSVHIPNGSGNGWKKVDALETLAEGVANLDGAPVVVAGDFNEPATFESDGRVRSWRWELDKKLEGDFDDGFGSVRARMSWQKAVEILLARGAASGLRHAWFDRYPDAPMPATHITRGDGARVFDHILVSRHLAVSDAGFDHGVRAREARTSDHSLAWADVAIAPISVGTDPNRSQ